MAIRRSRRQQSASEAGRAGVFGASQDGAGVMGYSRNGRTAAIVAFGGLRAAAMTHPFAGEFQGDVQVAGRVFSGRVLNV